MKYFLVDEVLIEHNSLYKRIIYFSWLKDLIALTQASTEVFPTR